MLSVRNQKGNITFYLAFVLPITLVFLIIAIDITQWQFLREEAQREADGIALELAQYLPHKELAENAFNIRANDFNSRSDNLKVSLETLQAGNLDAGSLQIRVTGQQNSIADTLMAAFTGQEVTFPVDQTASARVVPYDLMLVLSDAVTLRPQAFNTFGSPSEWPESDYFNFISPPTISVNPPPTPPRGWPNWWQTSVFNDTNFRRWTTQLCYSPVTLPLKQSALMLIDQVGAAPQNRIGVYSTPGDIFLQVGFSAIKELSYFDSTLYPVYWSNYFEPDVANSDEACLLYSHQELGLSRYLISPNISSWNQSNNCAQAIAVNPFSYPTGHYPNPADTKLSTCFINGGVSLREAVFYRAVRMHPHELGASNVSRAINSAVGRLVEEEKVDPDSDLVKRKGLVSSANKILVVLSDLIPNANDPNIQEALNGFLSDQKIKIYIFAYNHQALDSVTKDFNIQNVSSYNGLSNSRLFAKIVNESSMVQEVGAILANEKRIVISK